MKAYAPGLVFSGIGLVIAGSGLWLTVQRGLVVLTWPEAPAVVTESRVETRGSQHAARIRVRFETPDGIVEAEPDHDYRYSGHATAAEAVLAFAQGGEASVRYDPDDPKQARLEAGFNLATFGLPLLLAAVGLLFGGVGALAIRSARLEREPGARARRAEVRTVASFVLAIGLAFLATGVAVLPGAIEARSWPVVSARVERGDVYSRSSTGARLGKGGSVTRYVARVFVAYEHEGRTYLSPIDAGSRRNKQEAEQMVASIPKGTPREIRVDPRRPNRISRVDSWPLVFPTAFLAAGLVVSAVAVRLLKR